jgi:F-type H+-transporting ATPase subunit delta
MSEIRVAYRYALAIIGVAEETKCLDEVNRDFQLIEKLINEVREFSLFLKNPILSDGRKKQVFTELLKNRVSDLTFHFILLLVAKDREKILPEIIRQFYRLRDERLGIMNVTTKTAIKFTTTQEQELVRKLTEATKKQVRMKYVVDPALKGGFTVQFDDTVWDASVVRQLDLLKQKFIEGIS